ncbi:hypothetical protein Salat_1746100 [Sesamum alatum]|uniref:Uncharacterized protein n=1 Tax=Sesamum alatum TaxID=300844 RepID=A0AAE1Y987_9LAMI|nr:hypothetical protein Salat_1746100 [Sesamum alatum]
MDRGWLRWLEASNGVDEAMAADFLTKLVVGGRAATMWWRVLWRDSAVGSSVRSRCWRRVCHDQRQRLEWTAAAEGKQRRPAANNVGRRFGQQGGGGGELRSGGRPSL